MLKVKKLNSAENNVNDEVKDEISKDKVQEPLKNEESEQDLDSKEEKETSSILDNQASVNEEIDDETAVQSNQLTEQESADIKVNEENIEKKRK
ncbi:hypothetical protein [Apilactobacillus ozensis]|uniref:hypothetical protein n=1 Tax=Apilactobacillus ozensis TaxID=866801 RepID=UPI002092ABBB|nr:hypothetical protein [Apilactobacillus ozensis]